MAISQEPRQWSPDDEPAMVPKMGHAMEWGLASLIIAGVLFLAAPMTLILAVQVWRFADTNPGTVHLHAWLARVGVSIALLTALTSVVIAIAGIRSAMRWRNSSALSLAGLILSLAAFGLWIITAIGTLNATESLLHLYGR